MADTLLIWFNPDQSFYEVGEYLDYQSIADQSSNKDRFEVIYEFYEETIGVADKILNSLNKVHANSQRLNY